MKINFNSLRLKMLGALLPAVILTAALGYFSRVRITEINQLAQDNYHEGLVNVKLLGDAINEARIVREHLILLQVVTNEAEQQRQIDVQDEHAARMSALIEQYTQGKEAASTGASDQITTLIGRFDGAWQDYLAAHDEVVGLILDGKLEEAESAITGYADQKLQFAIDLLLLMQDVEDNAALERFAESQSVYQSVRNLSSILPVVATGLSLGLSFWVSTLTTRNINKLVGGAELISTGDLDHRVAIASGDEVGTLADAFNQMADQLAGNLEDLEERARALATSSEVSRRLSTIIERQQLVLEVVEQVQEAFNYYHAHIYLLDEASGDLVMAGGTGAAGRELLASGHKIAKGRGLVGRAAESNTVVLVPDVSNEPGWLPNRLLPDTQAEIAVPVATGARVLGVLDVQHDIPDGLNEDDARLLESIAGQVAVALQNILLFEEAQEKIRAEVQITEITQRIQGATSTDDILQVAARELGRALGAKRSTVHLNVGDPSDNGQEQKPDPVLTEHKED